jgi:hypothetical protein
MPRNQQRRYIWRDKAHTARAYLILRCCGYTHREVSQALDISPATALRWIEREYGHLAKREHFGDNMIHHARAFAGEMHAFLGEATFFL